MAVLPLQDSLKRFKQIIVLKIYLDFFDFNVTFTSLRKIRSVLKILVEMLCTSIISTSSISVV